MVSNTIVAVLSVLLGIGGTGGVGLFVTMIRAHRKGKIEDDGTTIERLNAEAKDLVGARKHAEVERDQEHHDKMDWMTQAFTYRRQLAAANIIPDDDPKLWIRQMPVIDP